MRLSPAAAFALRGIAVLADNFGQGPISLEVICSHRDLPKQYLAKIFSGLAKAGLVTPVRGKHGGYMLAREPGTMTILEVIEAVQGRIELNYCQHIPPKCDQVNCPMRAIWTELQEIIRGKLGSVTLADCVGS